VNCVLGDRVIVWIPEQNHSLERQDDIVDSPLIGPKPAIRDMPYENRCTYMDAVRRELQGIELSVDSGNYPNAVGRDCRKPDVHVRRAFEDNVGEFHRSRLFTRQHYAGAHCPAHSIGF